MIKKRKKETDYKRTKETTYRGAKTFLAGITPMPPAQLLAGYFSKYNQLAIHLQYLNPVPCFSFRFFLEINTLIFRFRTKGKNSV